MNKDQAQSSIKSLAFELSNLTPSAMVTLFEIDLSDVLDANSIPTLTDEASAIGFPDAVDRVLRFHNNIKVFNSKITWNGNDYYPVPIQATGFETSSKGTLPTPVLTIASQTEEGVTMLSLLKHHILKYGDIIGSKVTRRRTFAKYLDWVNFEFATQSPAKRPFSPRIQELPAGYEPDPNAELPKDVYFIERKTGENKNTIQYQLSSILDLEGVKIPRRLIVADKCNWQYRGPGCWYQHIDEGEIKNSSGNAIEQVPVLQKADLTTKEFTLPKDAPPVANDKDESIVGIIDHNEAILTSNKSEWNIDAKSSSFTNNDGEEEWYAYNKGDYTYIIKNKIKYYFVAKVDITEAQNRKNPPPNTNYWVADVCSKTLGGCRLRWGADSPGAAPGACQIGGPVTNGKGGLPFGGFPAARKVAGGR